MRTQVRESCQCWPSHKVKTDRSVPRKASFSLGLYDSCVEPSNRKYRVRTESYSKTSQLPRRKICVSRVTQFLNECLSGAAVFLFIVSSSKKAQHLLSAHNVRGRSNRQEAFTLTWPPIMPLTRRYSHIRHCQVFYAGIPKQSKWDVVRIQRCAVVLVCSDSFD